MALEFTTPDRRLAGILEPEPERAPAAEELRWRPCTKQSLMAVAAALRRTFASESAADLLAGGRDEPRLVVAFFEQGAYYEAEALRYESFAATGATVVVGYAGAPGGRSNGVELVDLGGRDQLVDSWALVVAGGSFAAALVAVSDGGLAEHLEGLEISRTFLARWTFRRDEAAEACRQLLGPIRSRLPARVLARAEAALGRTTSAPLTAPEERLLTVLEVLGTPAGSGPGTRRRVSPAGAGDLDLLTGLRNRQFLDRFVASSLGQSAARIVAMLVDVDDLGQVNSRLGVEAGDAALIAIAQALGQERRPGDVIVRYREDEFLVLAPTDGSAGALELAERVVRSVRALRLPHPYSSTSVTVSVGAIVADPAQIPFDRLEDGLHLAKLLGKNSARLVE